MNKYYLTKERLEELKQELETLKGDRRREVAEHLKRAKEYGDLSENSEYAEAREEQSAVETRIFELEELLKNVAVIEKSGATDVVRVGSTVTAKKGEKVLTYSIVGAYETNPEEGKISDESPLGRAFLNRRAGDKIKIETPAGSASYSILKVE